MSISAGRNVFKVIGDGELAGADQAAGVVIDLLMDRLEEVQRLQKIGDPVERLVVDQDRAEQGLFRLDIVRSHAVDGCRFRRLLARGRIERCHDVPAVVVQSDESVAYNAKSTRCVKPKSAGAFQFDLMDSDLAPRHDSETRSLPMSPIPTAYTRLNFKRLDEQKT